MPIAIGTIRSPRPTPRAPARHRLRHTVTAHAMAANVGSAITPTKTHRAGVRHYSTSGKPHTIISTPASMPTPIAKGPTFRSRSEATTQKRHPNGAAIVSAGVDLCCHAWPGSIVALTFNRGGRSWSSWASCGSRRL